MMNWIYKRLNVSDHEVARVNYMWGLQFFWQVGFVFAWTVVTALFLDLFGLENIMYLFLIDAWLLIAGSYIAHICFLRVPLNHFLYVNVLATFGFLGIAWFGRAEPVMFFTGLILAKDLFFSQIRIAILRRNESLMSPSEATHLMPVVETSLTIGTIVGAGAFITLLSFMPSKSVLFFWTVPLLGLLALIHWGPKYLNTIPQLQRFESEPEENTKINWRSITRVRFLALMGLVVMIQGVLWSLLEFEFLKSITEYASHSKPQFDLNGVHLQANLLQDALPEVTHHATRVMEKSAAYMEHSVAHSLGFLELIFGIVALIVQGGLASSVLKRLGVVYTMLAFFGGLLVFTMAFAFGGIGMNLLKGYKHGFHALFMSAYHLSFYSVFSKSRESVRHFFEGFVYPAGIIVGAGSMILCSHFLVSLDYLMVVIVGVLCLLMIPMRQAFTCLSQNNLKSDQCILTKMHSIEVLGQKGHHKATQYLSKELLRTELHPVVREKIIITLNKVNEPSVVHTYVQIIENKEESDEIKAQVLEASLKLGSLHKYWEMHAFSQYHLLEILKGLFAETENRHLRKLIVMNIFAHLPTGQVVPFFLEILETGDEDLASVCLRSAGEIFNDPEIAHYLRRWLDDPNPKIRGYALIALWKFEAPDVLRPRLAALLKSKNEAELIAGIYAAGEIQDPGYEVELLHLQDHPSEEIHMHALVALAKLGHDACLDQVLDLLFDEDEVRSQRVFAMLKRAPKIRSKLKKAIQFEVSRRVMEILLAASITKAHHLNRLPNRTKKYLGRLYRLAEKYDELLHLD